MKLPKCPELNSSARWGCIMGMLAHLLEEVLHTCQAEKASNLTFSKCLHLVDFNNPRILMMHDKMAVTTDIQA